MIIIILNGFRFELTASGVLLMLIMNETCQFKSHAVT